MFDIWCDTFKKVNVFWWILNLSVGKFREQRHRKQCEVGEAPHYKGTFFINMGILPIVLSLKKDTLGENWGQDMSPGCYGLC